MLISVSLWCMDLLFSHQIDKIMLYLDYWENNVIILYIPMVKYAEKKIVSAVSVAAIHTYTATYCTAI